MFWKKKSRLTIEPVIDVSKVDSDNESLTEKIKESLKQVVFGIKLKWKF